MAYPELFSHSVPLPNGGHGDVRIGDFDPPKYKTTKEKPEGWDDAKERSAVDDDDDDDDDEVDEGSEVENDEPTVDDADDEKQDYAAGSNTLSLAERIRAAANDGKMGR